jgi:hypothetical protein
VALAEGSAEWVEVTAALVLTLPAATVTQVERVENAKAWASYAQRRAEVAAESPSGFEPTEVPGLFHGTTDPGLVDTICAGGLDFRHGSSAGMWGVALYLAEKASYSDTYSADAGGGLRQLFYVRASLGRVADMPPSSALRAPPAGHDSVAGTTGGSRVHMVYDLGQAYPDYVVTYRR